MSNEKEKYIVSARKYRPSTFKTMVGQKTLTTTLRNAIATGRLAQAYLFCGPRGVGKTSCARIFAKTINCLSPGPDGEACGECASCRAIEEGNSFNLIELDAASNNGVDDIRTLIEQVNTPPQEGRYRVFIIDEVHMLSTAAFNAFLKTLEEPPAYVVFILATTEKHKVLPTILSRCQIYDFKRITVSDMADHLEYVASQEGIKAEREALAVIARKADGAMRDALSIFDQVAASSRGNVTYREAIENLNVLDYDYFFRLTEAFREGDVAQALLTYAEIRAKGFDSLFFVAGLSTHIRDLMLAASPATLPLLEQSQEIAKRYQEQATSLPLQWYYAALRLLNDCDQAYRTATEKRLLVELTLIRLCQLLSPPEPPFDRVDSKPGLEKVAPGTPSHASAAQVQGGGAAHGQGTSSQAQAQGTSAQATQATQATQTAAEPRDQDTPHLSQGQAQVQATVHTQVPSQHGAAAAGRTAQGRQAKASASRPRTLSFNQGASEAGNKAKEMATERKEAAERFSDDQLAEAWGEFAASHPELHILASAMRASAPMRISDTELEVRLTNASQLAEFDNNMAELAGFLRQRLRNDRVTLKATLDDTAAKSQYLSQADFLKKITTENPQAAEFIQKIEGAIL